MWAKLVNSLTNICLHVLSSNETQTFKLDLYCAILLKLNLIARVINSQCSNIPAALLRNMGGTFIRLQFILILCIETVA